MVATIWSTQGCVWCDRAKDLLTKESIPYTEKVIGRGYERKHLLEAVPGARSVPQIFMDGVYIGGYAELQKHLYPETGKNGQT